VWLVTGATGLVGRRLVRSLLRGGHVVRALTRDLRRGAGALEGQAVLVRWDGLHVPVDAADGAHAVVHLAGEPIFAGLATAARRERIRSSRIDTTRSLVEALAALPEPQRPHVLVCASAVGYYGSRGEEILDESSPAGEGFLARVCSDWESAAAGAERHGVRCAALRIGVVLAREGGALPLMARPFRLGLGGRLGSGQQWLPWIHIDDLVAAILAVARDPDCRGAVNAVAPTPVRNAELTRALAAQLGRPALLPVPAFALRLALGDLAGELLGSRRVLPRRLLERGFAFARPELAGALSEALAPA